MKTQVVPNLNPEIKVETTFVNLSEAQDLGLSRNTFQGLWGKVSNSQYKLFFTSFAKFVDYRLPIKFDIRTKQVALDETVTLDSISASKLKLDSTKIPNSLLTKFGILDQATKELTITAQVIDDLKAVFMAMTPVPGTNNRIQVITQDSPSLERLLQKQPDLKGLIVYFRKEVNAEHKLAMCFASISAAHRKTIHEEKHHTREVEQLTRLAKEVFELRNQIGDWGNLSDEERTCVQGFAREVATEVGDRLKNVLLLSKILAREQITKSRDISDRKGRKNPNANWARLHAAVDKFGKRVRSVTAITSANLEDRLALIKYRSLHSQIFDKAEGALRDLPKNLASFVAFKAEPNRRLSPEQTNTEVDNYLTRLGISDRLLSQIEARPYLTFKQQIIPAIADFRQAALDKDPEAGNAALKQIQLVLQVVKLQERLDNLSEVLTHGPIAFPGFKNWLVELKATSQSFYEINRDELPFVEGLSRQLEIFDLVITAANEVGATAVTEKTLNLFKDRFFSKLSFEKIFQSAPLSIESGMESNLPLN